MNNLKKDFPIFNTEAHKNLVYLDNGATTHKPHVLLESLSEYYTNFNSNVGRGVYKLAEDSLNAYEASRKTIAQFINTKTKNIVFTSGCTASLNQAAYIVGQHVLPKQKIVLSILEHHANILPWQRLAKEKDLDIIFIEDSNTLLNPEMLTDEFWKDVAVISLTHVSNVTGQINPIEKWCAIARDRNIFSVIDGAQGVCSTKIDIEKIQCDFYAFSSHKLYGPMGLGVLYIDNKIIQKSEPFILGGGIIEDVSQKNYSLLDESIKFEAGTPNVADAYGFSKVIEYLNNNNWPKLLTDMHELSEYMYQSLNQNKYIDILNNDERKLFSHSHIVSFFIKGIHSHDVGTFLANENIAVRVGKHCTYPFHEHLKINSSIRASLAIYNTKEDVDYFINKINECIHFFGVNNG